MDCVTAVMWPTALQWRPICSTRSRVEAEHLVRLEPRVNAAWFSFFILFSS